MQEDTLVVPYRIGYVYRHENIIQYLSAGYWNISKIYIGATVAAGVDLGFTRGKGGLTQGTNLSCKGVQSMP